jgi:hypothetical protein
VEGSSKEDNNENATPIKINYTGKFLPSSYQASRPNREQIDPRSLSRSDVLQLTEGNEGLESDKEGLFRVLENYVSHMTTKPGKRNLFVYKFQVQPDHAIVNYSRPIPFAIRPAVRKQIAQMVDDDILEISNSPILNPLAVVHKEGKKHRICVDARKVNQFTVRNYERVPPLQELLQKFEGTRYMSSIDLRSVYLQVELHKESRKYTAFLFDSTVYQFKRVPYGFKNSLSAFIRALRLGLGRDSENYVVFYVDDILVYSRTFEEHLSHLNEVISRITKARVGTIHQKLAEFLSLRSNGICTHRIVEWWREIRSVQKNPEEGNRSITGRGRFASKYIKGLCQNESKGGEKEQKENSGKSQWKTKTGNAVLANVNPLLTPVKA